MDTVARMNDAKNTMRMKRGYRWREGDQTPTRLTDASTATPAGRGHQQNLKELHG
jgi:hypothetical protein